MAQRILRPLTYRELFDEVFDLYKKNFVLFVGIAALITIPLGLAKYLIVTKGLHSITAQLHTPIPGSPLPGVSNTLVKEVLYQFIESPFQILMIGAMTWAISACYLERRKSIIDCYKAVLQRLPALVFTFLLEWIIIVAAICCCCLPIIPVAILLAFVTQVIVLEGYSGVTAIKRSAELTRFDWWKLFVVSVLMGVISIAVYMALMTSVKLIGGYSLGFSQHAHNPMPLAMQAALQDFIIMFTNPLCLLAIVLVYYDIRIRKEGFDLQLLAKNMGETPSAV